MSVDKTKPTVTRLTAQKVSADGGGVGGGRMRDGERGWCVLYCVVTRKFIYLYTYIYILGGDG